MSRAVKSIDALMAELSVNKSTSSSGKSTSTSSASSHQTPQTRSRVQEENAAAPLGSLRRRTTIAILMSAYETFFNRPVGIGGWVRTMRSGGGGKFFFVMLYDGTTAEELQVIVDSKATGFADVGKLGNGASLFVLGEIIPSPAKGQKIEMRATEFRVPVSLIL